ncbi:beta,beta-carotene 9',10'-oxygenase [Trichonephila inaurata madagascariensis]|uniref:Beta,beta-carotene 9',10'-oxygenase n=1 Tax=Trichonephila inaurata madagascariensis TaxID=2747483 RepID=A0A8X7C268_9ARAC|nr:beta,beta-carotene 9',10'-oxygenase [Trichonephila inaurata madagascariensis]
MDVKTASAVFPYLRSCKKESEKAIDGQVQGEIPRWLKGCLIRIGSGLLDVGPDRFNHVFDGLALMHKFTFEDGKVTYQNRFLRSDSYTMNMKANRIVSSEFGTRGVPDPCKTIFQRFFSLFNLENLTDNDLVNVILYADEPYACSESNCIWKIDPDTLESLEKVYLNRHVPVNAAIAHSHEDTDGTVYNIGSTFSLNCSYNILKFPPKENKEDKPFQNSSVVCKIPSSKYLAVSYHHSFAMSENYFVFVEQPLYLSVPKMAWAHFVAGTFADSLYWDPKTPTRFHVVRRSDMKLLDTVYISKPFFVFHHINMYEEDSHLKVDLCAYDDGEVVKSLYVKALEEMFSNPKNAARGPFVSKVERFVLPLNVGSDKAGDVNLVSLPNTEAKAFKNPDGRINLVPEVLTGSQSWSAELPRINYDFNGKKYRYSYSVGRQDAMKRTHLIKVDAVNKTVIHWSEAAAIPSEPVFISDPDSKEKSEDSGVILASLLFQNDETKVSMVVLDAKSMKEIGRVTFKTESSVPADFHGTFIPKE